MDYEAAAEFWAEFDRDLALTAQPRRRRVRSTDLAPVIEFRPAPPRKRHVVRRKPGELIDMTGWKAKHGRV